ncbi:DUF3343 domain-containing protein [Sinanaerobacter sp. ZZT-01]|uniref:DUF3343 domain-containing protein n=1 Tax=Sinanaerobacter sp. ZZT-01 TaxID=3111540 RepID=UPI002D7688FB|nr:DUF3343 domain-containing protein [Sinanaerobacter sp. ZZT-01]WRR93271.1 DUF3343 domain-containing protein [Sinanaerobacter sp. ZZT-01]
MKDYVIAFSSFYKAAYAQEKLQEQQIRSTLKKTPPKLLKSCGYALYARTNQIQNILDTLSESNINHSGVYEVQEQNNQIDYIRVD